MDYAAGAAGAGTDAASASTFAAAAAATIHILRRVILGAGAGGAAGWCWNSCFWRW